MPRRAYLWQHTTCLAIEYMPTWFQFNMFQRCFAFDRTLGWATLRKTTSGQVVIPGFSRSFVAGPFPWAVAVMYSRRMIQTDKARSRFQCTYGFWSYHRAYVDLKISDELKSPRINTIKEVQLLFRKKMHFWDRNWHATASRWRITMRSGSQCTTTELVSWLCWLITCSIT